MARREKKIRFAVDGALCLAGAAFLALGLAVAGCDQKPSPDSVSEKRASPQKRAEPAAPAEPVRKASEEIKEIYQWYCAQCHGIRGRGDGINARLLTVLPRDHTHADYLETRTDEQLFQAIKLGGVSVGRAPCMPRWGHTLNDDTIRGLVRYIRELCRCEAS